MMNRHIAKRETAFHSERNIETLEEGRCKKEEGIGKKEETIVKKPRRSWQKGRKARTKRLKSIE